MEGIEDRVAIKVQALSDLELAVLVCLTADQHCIIETDRDLIDDVETELQLVNAVDSYHDETPAETNHRLHEMCLVSHVPYWLARNTRRLMISEAVYSQPTTMTTISAAN